MDVLITGAGIGGLALAQGLVRAGHQVRVLERAPGLREGGASVTIFSNGAAAAAGLGVPLTGLGGRIADLQFCTAEGDPVLRLDLAPLQRRTGFGVAAVPRRDLVARLAHSLPPGVVQFDRAVVSAHQVGDLVEVVDTAGQHHTAQVLVGADGHGSAVRRTVLSQAPATDSGWATWQGLSAVLPSLAASDRGTFLTGRAGFVGLMPAGSGLVQWWFDVPFTRDAPLPESPTTWLRQRFAAYGGPVPALLEAITDTDVGLYPHVLHQVPDQWGTGATTLLGDAAHAFPPTQAQGANQALEDAWLLTRSLTATDDVASSLRRYERLRARRVRRVSRMAATETTNQAPGRLTRAAARLVPSALSGRAYATLLKSFSSVLNDER